MIRRQPVRHECASNLVLWTVPALPGIIRAEGKRVVIFGIGKGLEMWFLPANTHESAERPRDRLVDVDAEPVLDTTLSARVVDDGYPIDAVFKALDRFPIVAHVGVVEIGQQ